MKNKKIITLAMLALICSTVVSCNRSDNNGAGSVPNINLLENASAASSDALSVSKLTRTQLSGDSADAFFKDASIIDVAGDTVVLLENTPAMSRLIMFDLKTGNYIGQVNHRGQGAGEYRLILGAFVNDNDGTVLLPLFDKPTVYKYSLADDSLLSTIEREPVMTMMPAIGGVNTCINVAVPSPEGLTIRQYNSGYKRIDSVAIAGFQGGNFNTVWDNAGNNGVIMIADTLYSLVPGELKQLAVVSRGDKALTSEKDQEITMNVMTTGEDEKELLKPYILVRNVQYTDGKMLLTTMTDGVKHSDLYDMSNGNLLYRSTYDTLSKPNSMTIKDDSGKSLAVERLFAKDGKWYGILSEDGSTSSEDSNNVIICFEM